MQRFIQTMTPDEIMSLDAEQALGFLTPEERKILGTEYLSFDVNVPVVVSILSDKELPQEPYWLKDRKFQSTGKEIEISDRKYAVWQKNFDVGRIGLGVNSLTGGGRHYYVLLKSANKSDSLSISNIYPGQYTLGIIGSGESSVESLKDISKDFNGQITLIPLIDRRNEAQLTNVYKTTDYPSSTKPDLVVLTWSDDPKTTQTIQWRTGPSVDDGYVRYQKKADYYSFKPKKPLIAKATSKLLETPNIINDPSCYRHTVVLKNLERVLLMSTRLETANWQNSPQPRMVRSLSHLFIWEMPKMVSSAGDHSSREPIGEGRTWLSMLWQGIW